MLGELDLQQAHKTSIQLGIPTDFIKKDYFVTQAILTLTRVEDEYFSLIFQGGTSLSKGYQVIHRLSEDIDFRIIEKPTATHLGKAAWRKHLRDFRYSLITALQAKNFIVTPETVRIFYEGRFMRMSATFDGSEKISYLKPHIAIECFTGELALAPQIRSITSLIKVTLGEECSHLTFPVACVALDETAAEKWVALTRRVAGTQEKQRPTDKHLVRHLYDLFHLLEKGLLTGKYRTLIHAIMQKDQALFKKHNTTYIENPLRASALALHTLAQESQWQHHWNTFLEQMVYEKNKPTFAQALNHLQFLSQEIFDTINIKCV